MPQTLRLPRRCAPRNDTQIGTFLFENGRFHFLRSFFARYCSVSFFKRFVPEIVPFSRKTHQICHCEEGACARRGNLKRSDLPFRNELWLRRTKQSLEIKKEEARQRSESMFFVIGLPSCFVLPCFATGCHTSNFKIATAALRPRNDTKMVGFAIKPAIFISKIFEIRLAGTPCFATGCHTFGLKIATAALRPRNDTKNGRFCNKTYHFCSKNV